METKNNAIRDARTLGIPKMLLLGLQHMFAMFGATILVPILVNNYFKGEGLCTKLKVPAFLGSSFAFLGGFETVSKLDTGIFKDMSMGEKLPYACGGIVVAGALYLVLALIIKLVGVKRAMRFLPPVVTGPIIICIGLSLAPSAVNNVQTNWLLAIIAFAIIVIFNIWGKGMWKIIPILLGIAGAYAVALILHLATSLSALVGGPANTTYGENTGVLELSRVHDPKVIRLAAIYAVVLSFIPKFAGIISTLPAAIVGGVSFILYGMIAAIGVRNVVENKVDFTKSRNLIIAATILVCGLGFSSGLTFQIAGTSITLTGLAIAAIMGVLLNAILPGREED